MSYFCESLSSVLRLSLLSISATLSSLYVGAACIAESSPSPSRIKGRHFSSRVFLPSADAVFSGVSLPFSLPALRSACRNARFASDCAELCVSGDDEAGAEKTAADANLEPSGSGFSAFAFFVSGAAGCRVLSVFGSSEAPLSPDISFIFFISDSSAPVAVSRSCLNLL